MNPKALVNLTAYLVAGSLLIKVITLWIPLKFAFAIGMILCLLISLLSKLKISLIVILSMLYCLLLYLDNYFMLFWISDVKESDWLSVIGSGALFSLPGIVASVSSRLLKSSRS